MAKKIKSFDEVIGHANIIRYLRKCIEKDNVPNVMILHGNPGLGKSTIAKLVAVEVTTKYASQDVHDSYVKAVIDDNVSTDSIKLFNMSNIQEKEEEIQAVKAELSTGFSSTGRKVLILDEAHGMSKKAQDAILTELEHLPKDVYVFMCTTELGVLRRSLQSRSKATFRLNDLSASDTRRLIRNAILDRELTFDLNINMVVSIIAEWCGNQPRKAYNLIESFEVGSKVTSEDLEVFITQTKASVAIEMMKYIYGSMTLGINYIEELKLDQSFVTMMIEVLKVALDSNVSSMSRDDILYIKDFIKDKDVNYLLRFVANLSTLEYLTKNKVIGTFLKCHISFKKEPPTKDTNETYRYSDLQAVSENIQVKDDIGYESTVDMAPSLSDWFEQADEVK